MSRLVACCTVLVAAMTAPARGADAGASKPAASPGKSAAQGTVKDEARAASRPEVSMGDLRDMIDQKINEVRASRDTPAVVTVKPRSVVRKKPAPKPREDILEGPDGPTQSVSGAVSPDGWSYSGATGPAQWAQLKPGNRLCAVGKRQSPIDIRDGIPVQQDPIEFDYHPSRFRVIDNGHTVQVNLDLGNGIKVMGQRYELQQFHFHRPSEERINGRAHEMVVHLVHRNPEGREAIVAVLLDQGGAHPVVQQVWNNLPLEKHQEQAAQHLMDLTGLLPEQRQYYAYMGSQTTPPCTEGVLWLVMKQPVQVSPDQIGVFGRLYPMNARPVQPTAGRLIKEGM
ncbi:MAG TPA: carbonic anhydrase family protein [Aquabacterium sp.]|nr:carbonic anhydrase family protein [Aquabacterium sp.]